MLINAVQLDSLFLDYILLWSICDPRTHLISSLPIIFIFPFSTVVMNLVFWMFRKRLNFSVSSLIFWSGVSWTCSALNIKKEMLGPGTLLLRKKPPKGKETMTLQLKIKHWPRIKSTETWTMCKVSNYGLGNQGEHASYETMKVVRNWSGKFPSIQINK